VKKATLTAAVPTLKRALREEAEVEDRLLGATLVPDERSQEHHARCERSEHQGGRPAALGRLDNRVDQDAEAGGRERSSEQVEPAGPGIAALGHVADSEQQGGGRERHIDQEDRPPVEPLEQQSAGELAETYPDCCKRGPDGDRLAALLAAEEVGDDRKGGGHDQRRAYPHRRAHGYHALGRVDDDRAEAGEPEDRHAPWRASLRPNRSPSVPKTSNSPANTSR
jgi:hypothetical protein